MSQDDDFLEGIDEQFQRQMKLYGSGNGRTSGRSGLQDDRLIRQIVDLIETLTPAQKQDVIEFILSMKPKAD